MSEEKKILEEHETTEVPTPPKKRGRKKKTDIEAAAAKCDVPEEAPSIEVGSTESKSRENSDVKIDSTNETAIAEVNAIDDPTKSDIKIDTIEVSVETSDEVTSDEKEDRAQVDESKDAPKTEEVAESEDVAESEELKGTENIAKGEGTVEGEDIAENDDVMETDGEDEADTEGTYANIEHFSDTYEIKYLSDEVETASEIKEDAPVADAEYENLKIFEDSTPNVKREPKQKRVREVSPDYKEYNEDKPRHVDARFDFIELFVYTLVVIMLITTFFFKHSEVSGWSMKGTLSDKDHVLITDFLYEPKQYDIVVVHDPAALEDAVVKRIIALGGQTVRLEYTLVKEKSNMSAYYALDVFVDGEKVPDQYCYCDGADYSLYALDTGHTLKGKKIDSENIERYEQLTFEYVVPDGEIYVMGDHRNDSTDSRRFGSVNENKILGHLILRFFPFDSFGTVD